jgi:hypothetical protein
MEKRRVGLKDHINKHGQKVVGTCPVAHILGGEVKHVEDGFAALDNASELVLGRPHGVNLPNEKKDYRSKGQRCGDWLAHVSPSDGGWSYCEGRESQTSSKQTKGSRQEGDRQTIMSCS